MAGERPISLRELREVVYQQIGYRPPLGATEKQLNDLLGYKLKPEELPNRVNTFRDNIIKYVADNKDNLSIPCHGRCYEHPDEVVLFCQAELEIELGTRPAWGSNG